MLRFVACHRRVNLLVPQTFLPFLLLYTEYRAVPAPHCPSNFPLPPNPSYDLLVGLTHRMISSAAVLSA